MATGYLWGVVFRNEQSRVWNIASVIKAGAIVLKNIAVSDLRLGMYIDEFCGSAIEHSIWKYGFLLQSEHDLKCIQNSDVSGVWINVCKGIDVDGKQPSIPGLCHDTLTAPLDETPGHVSFNQEVSRAVKLCARSKAAVEEMFRDLRLGRIIKSDHVSTLVSEISDSVMRHPDAFISLVRLKRSDEYTYLHSVAVCALMIALARQLSLSPNIVHEAGVAGLMHDVGKAAIPLAILNKPGTLNDDEHKVMRQHPEAGVCMLRNNPVFTRRVLDVCLHHHEKFDGSGYPHKLAGSQISLLARMGAICDVYDAVTSNRPYKNAWGPAEAIHRMAEWKGHFDDRLFQAFVKCVGIYPVGSLVRLHSGRVAVVIEQHDQSLLTPHVKVFFCAHTQKRIPEAELDLSVFPDHDWIVGREPAERWGFKNLEALWSGQGRSTAVV